MAEQAADHRRFAVGDRPDHEGQFDVGPQFDQAQLADLGERAVARGPAEARRKAAALASESGTS